MPLYTPNQPGFVLGGRLVGADFNSTADQAIIIAPPCRWYSIFRMYVINPSTSLTTAQGSLYLNASKAAPVIFATTTPFTGAQVSTIDTLNNVSATSVTNTVVTDNTTIYLSLTTAQGSAATGDLYVYIVPLWGA
jgi:hypothetical protein